MKTKILVTILLSAFLLSAPSVYSQDRHEKKLKREMAKLEKQMKKVRKLQGEVWFSDENLNQVRQHELQQALEMQKHAQEKAMQQQQYALQKAFEAKDYYKNFQAKDYYNNYQAKVLKDAFEKQNWGREFYKEYPEAWHRYGDNWEEAWGKGKAFVIQKEAMEQAKMHQREAMEKAMNVQREALDQMRMEQKQALEAAMSEHRDKIEQLKIELKKAKEELEAGKENK